MDDNLRPRHSSKVINVYNQDLNGIHILDFIEQHSDILLLLQVGLQDSRRGRAGESLANNQHARVLEGVENRTAEQATGSSNKNVRCHFCCRYGLREEDGEDFLSETAGPTVT